MRPRSSPIPLIAQREIRQRLRSKAFFVFTGLIAVAIIGIALLNRALSNDGPTSATVVVTGQAPPGLDATLRAAGDARNLRVDVATAPDRAAAVSALDGGGADAAIVVPASGEGELLFRRRVDSDLQATVASAWQVSRGAEQASQLGIKQGDISQILNPTPLRIVTIEPESANKGIAQLVGTLAAILLFISVSTFGGFVLTGVVEEKTTAVIEILLAQVRAHQLLAGKVLGIGTVALVQFVTAVAAGLVALRISGASTPSAEWVAVPSTVGWFVAGFALYSTLFALAGSFVSRQEDAQAAAAPISMLFLAAYLVVSRSRPIPAVRWRRSCRSSRSSPRCSCRCGSPAGWRRGGRSCSRPCSWSAPRTRSSAWPGGSTPAPSCTAAHGCAGSRPSASPPASAAGTAPAPAQLRAARTAPNSRHATARPAHRSGARRIAERSE